MKEEVEYSFRHVHQGRRRRLEDLAFFSGVSCTIEKTTGWWRKTYYVTFSGTYRQLQRAAEHLGYDRVRLGDEEEWAYL